MKKVLVVSAIAALGLTSVALAGGIPETMPAAPTAVSTSDAGVYVGLSGGFGMTNWKNAETSIKKVSKDNGFVGRVFLGYDINKYFATEFGYSYFFNKPELNAQSKTMLKGKRTQAFDLMAKIKAPVVDNFDLYGKVGVNYLMTSFDTKGVDSTNNFNVGFGAGADYYVNPNVIVNVEWLRFNGKAKINDDKYQPNTDAFLVGLRYKFDI